MKIEDLSEHEKAKYAACVNPDADGEQQSKFTYSPEFEQQILATLLNRKDIMEAAAGILVSGWFANQSREYICKILLSYWKEHQEVPTKVMFQELIRASVPESKLIPTLAELAAVYASYEPALHHQEELVGMVDSFAQQAELKRITYQIAIEAGENRNPSKAWELLSKLEKPSILNANNKAYSSWPIIRARAEEQAEDWLIPNWSEFGCLTLFSSLPKLGKSTIVAELIACLMLERDFYGQRINPCPVLLVDPENREKTLVRRLTHACGSEGEGRLPDWFYRMNAFPKPLDNAYLKRAIENVKAATGQERIVVVLDTLRSCYSGKIENENDNSEMSSVLVPLKDMANELQVALFVVHHNSKGSDTYAGGTAILGTVDYYWNWTNSVKTRQGELSCWGRGDCTEPIKLKFNLETQRNSVFTGGTGEPTVDKELLKIPTQAPGVTIEHLIEAWEVHRATAYRWIKAYIEAGKVEAVVDTGGVTHYRQTVVANATSHETVVRQPQVA